MPVFRISNIPVCLLALKPYLCRGGECGALDRIGSGRWLNANVVCPVLWKAIDGRLLFVGWFSERDIVCGVNAVIDNLLGWKMLDR